MSLTAGTTGQDPVRDEAEPALGLQEDRMNAQGAAGPDDSPRPLGPLLEPGSVAIVGASERRPDIVQTACAGTARTWLVNPGRDAVLGQRCYPSTVDLPEVTEVAMIVIRHQA